jgi:hypothetical protein
MKNRYFVAIFIFILFGCSKKYNNLKQKIDKELGVTLETGIVLLISKDNCVSCFENSIYSWIDYADTTNYPIYGLFYSKSKKFPLEHKLLMDKTKIFIEWRKTKRIELITEAAMISGKDSPFILIVKNGNILYLDKLKPSTMVHKTGF